MILRVSDVSPRFDISIPNEKTCQATKIKKIMEKRELIEFIALKVLFEYRVASMSTAIWAREICAYPSEKAMVRAPKKPTSS